jgi:hypothetical protein
MPELTECTDRDAALPRERVRSSAHGRQRALRWSDPRSRSSRAFGDDPIKCHLST